MELSLRGLGDVPANRLAEFNAVVCPAGFTKEMAAGIDPSTTVPYTADYLCYDSHSNSLAYTQTAQGGAYASAQNQDALYSKLLFAGALGSLFLLDGWAKLLAVPIALYGFHVSCQHGECGM